MTNDEIRRNGEPRTPKPRAVPAGGIRHLNFGFLSAFGIRHSSFLSLLLAVSCSHREGTHAGHDADDAIPITLTAVETVTMDEALDVWGTLYAKDEATLGAEVEGRVERTLVDFGDRVKAGQELALIDTTTYEALARQAGANLAKARASADNAGQNLQRSEELRKSNIASQSDLDAARAVAEQARAGVRADEAADAIAALNVERSRVRAPFDAAIVERVANAGDYLKVGAPLFRIVNDNVLKFIVQAPESYAGRVVKEQPVEFWVDAYGSNQTFQGRVYLISPAVNTATRAFPFGALVQNADHKLKANSYARGRLVLARNVPTTVVPLDALSTFAGVSRVFVVEGAVARSRDVTPGHVLEGRQQILAGLKPGERVATSGLARLHDGAKIRVREAPAPGAASATAQGPIRNSQ